MRRVVCRLLVPLFVAAPLGCYRHVVESRTHQFTVESEPPGAIVRVRDSDVWGAASDPAPVELEVEYQVKREALKGEWLLLPLGALVVGSVGGILFAGGPGGEYQRNGEAFVAGIALLSVGVGGMLFSLIGGVTAASLAEGDIPVEPRDVLFRAELEGYHPSQFEIRVPPPHEAPPDEPVLIRLEPLTSEPLTSVPPAPRPVGR